MLSPHIPGHVIPFSEVPVCSCSALPSCENIFQHVRYSACLFGFQTALRTLALRSSRCLSASSTQWLRLMAPFKRCVISVAQTDNLAFFCFFDMCRRWRGARGGVVSCPALVRTNFARRQCEIFFFFFSVMGCMCKKRWR